ncbi:Dimeric alpha-beta barrel [Penicillium coprophilum]|uniref:Dimeric alpha-beta barrel n=1 Tax=Penicillium coprophilum TaxID=36646 RepID=UPI002387AE49|nr:Dimeric alpha-beta barrel [Penicillium coprophilum]KAJ5158954.1 Dimeric alpha-beta barrel [Penicillium coprophilum]
MTAPVTEVTIVPLVKGADPRVENSDAAKILNRANETVMQQPGFQRMIWGLDKKDPSMMVGIVAAPYYQAFIDDFNQIIAGPIVLFHTTYEEGVGIAPLIELKDQITDVSLAFFPAGSLTQGFQDDLSWVSQTVKTDLLKPKDAPSSIVSGWCTDDALDEERHGKGPERPWMSMVTWKNTKARQRAWNRQAVLGDIPKLVEGKGELEIYEVEFQPVISRP